MDKLTYDKLKKEIQDRCSECRKDIAALDQLYRKIGSVSVEESEETSKFDAVQNGHSVTGPELTRRMVREALRHAEGEFSSYDVQELIKKNNLAGKENVSAIKIGIALKALSDSSEIALAKQGNGKVPSTYRLK